MTAKIICQREKMIDDTFEEIEDASNPLKDKLPMIIEFPFCQECLVDPDDTQPSPFLILCTYIVMDVQVKEIPVDKFFFCLENSVWRCKAWEYVVF